MANCKVCNKVFEPYHKNGKMCSKECRALNYSNNYGTEYKKVWQKGKGYDYHRNRKYIDRYGLTTAEVELMKTIQSNKCCICKVDFDNIKMCVDHCHTTGKVRGLLCDRCNTGLGAFKDDVNSLANAINYLKRGTNE
jgi:glycerol-3-phosphate dehydrogenase